MISNVDDARIAEVEAVAPADRDGVEVAGPREDLGSLDRDGSGRAHPDRHLLDRRSLVRALAVGGAVIAGLGAAGCSDDKSADRLVARLRRQEPPLDPLDPAWLEIKPFPMPMLAQISTIPHASGLSVPEIKVRAIHDGQRLAVAIEWEDEQPDSVDAMGRFRDAVAVMLPVIEGSMPAVTMGSAEQPVHILQWRAAWQADVDLGRQGVKDAFPNMFHDAPPEALMGEEAARQFYPALAVGNPMADRQRETPVEELTAVGFGSLTSHEDQSASGKGVYDGGGWKVVIAWPMSGGAGKSNSKVGSDTSIAFAVWNGSAEDRGGRKQWANWTPVEIEAP